MRVLMRAGFDRYTGYGNDAIDLARFLERQGVDVIPFPLGILPGLPREFTRLLEKEPGGKRPDVVLQFSPPFDLKPKEFAHLAPKAVGYSMWEKSKLTPDDMLGHGWVRQLDPEEPELLQHLAGEWWSHGERTLDLMLVTCQMNVDCFRALDPDVPLDVLPCGVDTDEWPELDRTFPGEDRPMTFGMCGMLAGRKDPWLMLDAWRELKEDVVGFDARLELKTNCPGLHPKIEEVYPDVKIHDRTWPKHRLREWYSTVDVMVSTSRGEGNNKPSMEFMSTGGTCIATDWSGHQNWLHADVAYPLRGVLRPAFTHRDDVLDFRGDKEHLKELILHCWRNPAEVRQKGQRAGRFIRQSLSWEVVCARLDRILTRLVADA